MHTVKITQKARDFHFEYSVIYKEDPKTQKYCLDICDKNGKCFSYFRLNDGKSFFTINEIFSILELFYDKKNPDQFSFFIKRLD